jgi:hypothetical protein
MPWGWDPRDLTDMHDASNEARAEQREEAEYEGRVEPLTAGPSDRGSTADDPLRKSVITTGSE